MVHEDELVWSPSDQPMWELSNCWQLTFDIRCMRRAMAIEIIWALSYSEALCRPSLSGFVSFFNNEKVILAPDEVVRVVNPENLPIFYLDQGWNSSATQPYYVACMLNVLAFCWFNYIKQLKLLEFHTWFCCKKWHFLVWEIMFNMFSQK